MKKIFTTLSITAALTIGAFAQNSATSAVSAQATIIRAITLENQSDLNFGVVVPSETAGTVVLSPDEIRTSSGGASLITSMPGTITSAKFEITGEPNTTYSLTLPTSIEISNGGTGELNKMVVNNFTNNSDLTLTTNTKNFNVGATLNVKAGQAVGVYSGTFNVTVQYN